MDIGQKIKEQRKKQGLSQKMLADKLRITPVMISQYENGKRKPKIETLQKIADALDTKVVEFNGEFDLVEKNTSVITEKNITLETIKKHPRLEKLLEECSRDYIKTSQNLVEESPFPFDVYTFNKANIYAKIDFYNMLFNRIDIHTVNNEEYYDIYCVAPDMAGKEKQDLQLRSSYSKLNNLGKQEAVKRIEELTQIEKYTK